MADTDGKAAETMPKKEEEEEELPIVKELKKLDDQYLALEREFEAEERALRAKYKEKQDPLLLQRKEILADPAEAQEGSDKTGGTPALKGFWLQALSNHPAIKDGESLQEWDAPVLEHLTDVAFAMIDDEHHLSFRLDFIFAENPYFEETVLTKTYVVRESSPWNGETEIKEIKSTKIAWKTGMDVTVELKKKKVKGGGAKKAKQGKEKMEPRQSFFRTFLGVNLTEGGEIPEGLELLAEEIRKQVGEEEALDEESILGFTMERDFEMGSCIKDSVIPFAIRWYTGEACEDDDDSDDEDEEEEEEDEDDDDDSEDEEEEKPKAKAKSKTKGAKADTGAAAKQEDCKQQ